MQQIERRDWKPFINQTDHPFEVQQLLLRSILERQQDTTFGRKFEFRRVRSFHDYRRAVPIHSYEELRPYIEEQERARTQELNAEHPLLYAQTSGTTGKPKYIPVLRDTRDRLRRYQRLFTLAQYAGVPRIFDGRIMVLSGQSVEGRLPTGGTFGSMSGLLFEALPLAVRRRDVLPVAVRALTDVHAKYWHIAACALAEPLLSVIATPNPSTLLKLLDVIRACYGELVDALSMRCRHSSAVGSLLPQVTGRRLSHLKGLIGHDTQVSFASLWPDLRAVITWMGGNCSVLIPRLRPWLPPATALIEMGYLSSECLGSLNVDVATNRCVPTFHDHVFEFVPLSEWETSAPKTLAVHEIGEGEKYHVVVTTPAGLYRYAMNDIVEVTGRVNGTPTIRFVQKGKGVTNITGEKLYEHHVTTAVDVTLTRLGITSAFYVMVADVEAQQYVLYVEHTAALVALAGEVDRALAELNVEYRAKRDSGRLKPVAVHCVRPGTAEAYKAHGLSQGQRESQFKLIRLQYRHECAFDFCQYHL